MEECFSQQDFILKTNIGSLASLLRNNGWGVGIVAEKGIKKNYSINVNLDYGHTINRISLVQNTQYAESIYLKKYFSKSIFLRKGYAGLYMSNSFRNQKSSFTDNEFPYEFHSISENYNYTSIGLLVGYQICTVNDFIFDAAIGGGASYNTYYHLNYAVNLPHYYKEDFIRPDFYGFVSIGYNISRAYKRYKIKKELGIKNR